MDFSKIKAVLFDMDGVLFDSMPNHAKAWEAAFASVGIEFSPYEAYLQEGRTGASTIQGVYRRLFGRDAGESEIKKLYDIKTSLFESFGEPVAMPGAAEALAAVKQKGLRICIVTGSGQTSLLDTLDKYFPGYFASGNVVSAFDVKRGKPDPEPYLLALQKMDVPAKEAVVIENAPLGVQAAVAAGIFTIAVNTGILKDEDLLQAGADMLLPDMFKLSEMVRAWS